MSSGSSNPGDASEEEITVSDVAHQLQELQALLCTVRTSGDAAHESAIAAMLAHLTHDSSAAESQGNSSAASLSIPEPSSIEAFEEQFLQSLGANRTPGASHSVVRCETYGRPGPIATDGALLFCTCSDCLVREGMHRGVWQPAPLDGTGIVDVGVQSIARCPRNSPTSATEFLAKFCFGQKVESIEKLYRQGPATGHVEVVVHELHFQGGGATQSLAATTLTQSTISDVLARGDDDPTRPVVARALLREAKRLYDSYLVHGHINADNALQVVAQDGTIAVAFIGFELTVCEDPEDAERSRDPNDQRAVAALFGDLMGVHGACANPWHRHVMQQLLAGESYNGLMLLEPGELRPALELLQKKLSEGAAARGLTGALLIEAEKALRVLVSTIPRGSIPSELYDPTCGKKNACLLVTVEKALSFMGRRFKTSGRGVELGFPPLVSNAAYVDRAVASWRATLDRKHGANVEHDIMQYPADASDGENGLLLFCDCRHCCDSESGNRLCPGVWMPSPDAPAVEVTAALLVACEADNRARRLFEGDVQNMTALYEAAGTSVRVVAHAFDFEVSIYRYHIIATTVGKGTLTETLRGPLGEPARLQLARAVLRGADLLVQHGLPHCMIEPDFMALETVDGTPKVAFLNLPLPSIQRPFPTEAKISELWAWSTIVPLLLRELDQWSIGMVLYEIMESPGLSDEKPQLPCYYQRLGTSGDPYTVQREWATQREALAEADTAWEAPIPPGTDPWLHHMMRRLLAGMPCDGLLSLEPAELRGAVAQVAERLDTPTMTALQPLLDVCDEDASTYDEVLAVLRRNDAGALAAVDEALCSARRGAAA